MNSRHLTMLVLGGWLSLGVMADTVRLKTGETFDGTILSETDTKLSIEVEHAGGTILTTETFNKSDIAEIVRATPEQVAQRAMEHAYANTQKYQLNPKTSYSLSYYNQVIDGVLRRFLADYPASPYTNAVQAKLKEWIAEQGTVAGGKTKFDGVWMRTEDAAKRIAEARVRSSFERGNSLMAQGQFQAAVEQFDAVLAQSKTPGDQTEARRLSAEAYRRWAEALERQRTAINTEIKQAEARLAKAQTARDAAEQRAAAAAGEIQRMGTDSHVIRARSDFKAAESRLAQLRDSSTALDRQLADVRSRTSAPPPAGAVASAGTTTSANATGLAATPTMESATAGSAAQKDVVNQVGGIISRYWVIGIVAVVALAWGCVYIFTRD